MRPRWLQAAIMLLPLVSLARGIDLLSLVVLLAVAAYLGTRRQASWTDAVGRAIDLSLAGLVVVALVVLTINVLPRDLHEAVTVTLTGAWAATVVVCAGLALTTADRPRWTPLLHRVTVLKDRPGT
ncbi:MULTISPECIES: hypothetical protein [unclassified Aeromicrobium]|uniref:hypothetical protein n=1 Tax=unclassified Aeromicrobium TaxID=2633570 RepID=UPI0006FF683F|nr:MULTISPECIES: hypothetical protein [unclassified Aeromicrobium]KQO36556.1 hypothetical protein ASF05_10375 [Aeromicrobium sp. Leaf245]KQP28006.1 hypothetical protein ASF38_04260 [Aeromicrobium sp. Leaf272]